MSSDDEDYGELQKEFVTLMEENRKLKQQTQKVIFVKRFIPNYWVRHTLHHVKQC